MKKAAHESRKCSRFEMLCYLQIFQSIWIQSKATGKSSSTWLNKFKDRFARTDEKPGCASFRAGPCWAGECQLHSDRCPDWCWETQFAADRCRVWPTVWPCIQPLLVGSSLHRVAQRRRTASLTGLRVGMWPWFEFIQTYPEFDQDVSSSESQGWTVSFLLSPTVCSEVTEQNMSDWYKIHLPSFAIFHQSSYVNRKGSVWWWKSGLGRCHRLGWCSYGFGLKRFTAVMHWYYPLASLATNFCLFRSELKNSAFFAWEESQ